jgi:peptide/nickel transport system substrate-binding protein
VRVDPGDLSVALDPGVGSGPTAVLPAFGSIWVANQFDGTVSRLDASTGRVAATVQVGGGPNALGASAGSVWVANETDDSITAIDPATDQVERTIEVGGAAVSLAADGDDLWLAVGASATEHRGGTLIVSAEQEVFSSLDPSVIYDAFAWQILSFTNDGLLAYKRVGGPDGATLVPDLASTFPQVSPDGLSYRFPLREGIRYSNGEPVRPEDFRFGLERAMSLSPDAVSLFRDLDGAEACAEDPSTCDLSRSIRTDESSVTFHLTRPDPDLPAKLTLTFSFPVPTSVPVEDQGLHPVPATGPYMIAEAGADGIELVRNPEFQEWSASAQPDGFVDSISFTFKEEAGPAFDRLLAGEIDWMLDPPLPEDIGSLQVQHPDRLVLSPNPFTIYVGFDLRRPPFDDVRVRRAVNYAIDRDHLVELLGGPTRHRPTCQILPPNFQGYEPFCPYTLEPESGAWSGPDVPRARALIEDAGAVGEEVAVWVMREDPFLGGPPPTMRYVTDVLNDIGLRAELTIKEIDPYFAVIYGQPHDNPPHVYLGGWATDYPGAANFIETQFRCGAGFNASGYCSDRLDERIAEAKQLQETDPAAANAAWIEIEHQLVREAVWAPLTNPLTPYAFSARVGNVQVHPQWGLLLSRVWVQ